MQYNRTTLPVIATVFAILATTSLHAQEVVPGFIDYQGYITELDGTPLGGVNGSNQSVEFRIYEEETGSVDDAIWAEEQTFTIREGLFSVRLGEGIEVGSLPRPDLRTVFAGGTTRFLGVTVDGQGGEISPRLAFLSTPYSMVAQRAGMADSLNQSEGTAVTNALQVTGLATAQSILSQGPVQVAGNNYVEFGSNVGGKQVDAGKIGYGTFSGGNSLDIVGAGTTGTNRQVQIWAEGGARINGPLHVTGTLSAGAYDMSNASLNFGNTTRQMLNLWGTNYGIGVQDGTLYSRADNHFAWYLGGSHSNGTVNSGGGRYAARLNANEFFLGQNYSDDFGLYVRGARGIRIESQAPGSWRMYHDYQLGGSGSDFRIQYATDANFWYWNSTGQNGRSSDIALKKHVTNLGPTLESVLALRPVHFRYKNSPDDSAPIPGFIAQEVETLFPELVVGEDGTKGLSDTGLIPITVMALQEEHQLRKDGDEALKEEIKSLRQENASLLERLTALEKHLNLQ